MKNKNVKKLVLVSILSAMSVILYYFDFSVPFFPSFLKYNFSMIPIMVATFILGPIEGLTCVLIRFGIKVLTLPSNTVYVGETQDLMIGALVCLGTGFFYRQLKNKKNKKLSLILSLLIFAFLWVTSAILTNLFYALPLYLKLYFGGDLDAFLTLLKIIPNVSPENYKLLYIFFAVLPFNLIYVLVIGSLLYILVYRLSFLEEERVL